MWITLSTLFFELNISSTIMQPLPVISSTYFFPPSSNQKRQDPIPLLLSYPKTSLTVVFQDSNPSFASTNSEHLPFRVLFYWLAHWPWVCPHFRYMLSTTPPFSAPPILISRRKDEHYPLNGCKISTSPPRCYINEDGNLYGICTDNLKLYTINHEFKSLLKKAVLAYFELP